MAKPTTAQPQLTEPTTADAWHPPAVAADRAAHRAVLAALPIGSPVLIWSPSGRPINGHTWCGLYGPSDCLVRSIEGDVRHVRQAWVRPA